MGYLPVKALMISKRDAVLCGVAFFMRVLKFGGTSVANAQRFVNVSEIAINTAIQVQTALVLSAPAGVTNILVSMVKSALAGPSV